MKLREDFQKYQVTRHGSAYVEPSANIIAVCPECYSTNVKGPVTKSLYTCNDCNCEFFMDTDTKLTKQGKFLRKFMLILSALFYALIFVVFIGSVLWLDSMEKKFGAEFVQTTYSLPTGLFAIVGIIVLCLLGWKCMSIASEI